MHEVNWMEALTAQFGALLAALLDVDTNIVYLMIGSRILSRNSVLLCVCIVMIVSTT